MPQLTVGQVVQSWARALVPTALATALLAGLLLLRGSALNAPLPVGVEELLVRDIQGETIPMMLKAAEAEAVSFASEIF